jgi:hypothetical protein
LTLQALSDGNNTELAVLEDNLNIARNIVDTANTYYPSERAKLAVVAEMAGHRYASNKDQAAGIIRSKSVADQVKNELSNTLQASMCKKFLREIADAISDSGKGRSGIYTTTPALKQVSAIGNAIGSVIGNTVKSGAIILDGLATVDTLLQLGELANRVNGLSPGKVDEIMEKGIKYYTDNCGSALNCGE